MPLDGVRPSVFSKAYGGSPPPVDQPGFVVLLKSKVVVGCDVGGGGDEGGGGEGDGEVGGMPTTLKNIGSHCRGQAPPRAKERDSEKVVPRRCVPGVR